MEAITKAQTGIENGRIVSNTLTVVSSKGLIVMTVFTIGVLDILDTVIY